ncbi:MAG: hypothetical protein methR_P0676 [Methyloprofundus sp.]|nr:MAG: hypothetical protein methR_P0676 [Methyloprofundus sp.]
MTDQKKKNQRTIIILALMTIIPFSVAWYLTEDAGFRPGSTNKGDLIIPLITTERAELKGIDAFSIKNIDELKGHWVLLNVIPSEQCNQVCAKAIHASKQIRLMINKELTRVRRAVIVMQGEQQTDYLAWKEQGDKLLSLDTNEYRKLSKPQQVELNGEESQGQVEQKIVWWEGDYRLIKVTPEIALAAKIKQLLGADMADGQMILMDPLGNLMMQYKSGFDPYAVKRDIKKLLRISQIG